MKSQKDKVGELASIMELTGLEFSLADIHTVVCGPSARELTVPELHSRCSRAIGRLREALKAHDFVLVKGALRYGYRAERKRRPGDPDEMFVLEN